MHDYANRQTLRDLTRGRIDGPPMSNHMRLFAGEEAYGDTNIYTGPLVGQHRSGILRAGYCRWKNVHKPLDICVSFIVRGFQYLSDDPGGTQFAVQMFFVVLNVAQGRNRDYKGELAITWSLMQTFCKSKNGYNLRWCLETRHPGRKLRGPRLNLSG